MDETIDSPSPRPGWWGRNWKWVVPVGCVTPVLLCGGLITVLVVVLFGAMKSSEPYAESLSRAQNNDAVKALLGEPIEAEWYLTGNISVSDDRGNADLTIPISGPKGKANIHVVANKAAGKWTYSRMEVTQDVLEKPINLLPAPKPKG